MFSADAEWWCGQQVVHIQVFPLQDGRRSVATPRSEQPPAGINGFIYGHLQTSQRVGVNILLSAHRFPVNQCFLTLYLCISFEVSVLR